MMADTQFFSRMRSQLPTIPRATSTQNHIPPTWLRPCSSLNGLMSLEALNGLFNASIPMIENFSGEWRCVNVDPRRTLHEARHAPNRSQGREHHFPKKKKKEKYRPPTGQGGRNTCRIGGNATNIAPTWKGMFVQSLSDWYPTNHSRWRGNAKIEW